MAVTNDEEHFAMSFALLETFKKFAKLGSNHEEVIEGMTYYDDCPTLTEACVMLRSTSLICMANALGGIVRPEQINLENVRREKEERMGQGHISRENTNHILFLTEMEEIYVRSAEFHASKVKPAK